MFVANRNRQNVGSKYRFDVAYDTPSDICLVSVSQCLRHRMSEGRTLGRHLLMHTPLCFHDDNRGRGTSTTYTHLESSMSRCSFANPSLFGATDGRMAILWSVFQSDLHAEWHYFNTVRLRQIRVVSFTFNLI